MCPAAEQRCNRAAARPVYFTVRWILPLAAGFAVCAFGQDPRDIVRRSVELDQTNWLRMADYTWIAHSRERHFDAHHHVTSDRQETWETIVLDGQPYRRTLEKDGVPLADAEQQKQQRKLDKAAEALDKETPEQKQRRADDRETIRRRERAFLLEIPDAYDFHLDGAGQVDGRAVWIISGVPKPGYRARSRDGAALPKIRGKMWVDKDSYQWARLEAQTIQTISFGIFLARLDPGATLVLEEERVNDEVWLPKREYMNGTGRVGLVKRIAEDDEITWRDYRKFRVESKLVPKEP